jgi:hypothetical protein
MHGDILENGENSIFGIITLMVAICTSMSSIIFLLYSMGKYSEPNTFILFLQNNQWVPILYFILNIFGWAFYVTYLVNHENWYDDENSHVLTFTMFYIWFVCTFSWVVTFPILIAISLIKHIFINPTIWFVRLITKQRPEKMTMTQQFDKFLRE